VCCVGGVCVCGGWVCVWCVCVCVWCVCGVCVCVCGVCVWCVWCLCVCGVCVCVVCVCVCVCVRARAQEFSKPDALPQFYSFLDSVPFTILFQPQDGSTLLFRFWES